MKKVRKVREILRDRKRACVRYVLVGVRCVVWSSWHNEAVCEGHRLWQGRQCQLAEQRGAMPTGNPGVQGKHIHTQKLYERTTAHKHAHMQISLSRSKSYAIHLPLDLRTFQLSIWVNEYIWPHILLMFLILSSHTITVVTRQLL
jgi:hypothetical protein